MNKSKERQECFKLYNQIIDGLEASYSRDEINDAEFSQLKTKTLTELEQSLADLTDIQFSQNMKTNYANFNMNTRFVPALVEQIEENYETIEDGMLDIQDATDITDDEVKGLFTGELVPTAKMVDILNGLFEATSTDNNMALGMQVLAALDRGDLDEEDLYEDGSEEEMEEIDEEDEDSDDDEEDEVEQPSIKSKKDSRAVYSAIDPRLQELESKIADFELNSELKNRLSEIAEFARQGINDGWLSRAKRDLLLGSFEREDDRVAAFSQTAEQNNVDLYTQLYAVQFALEADEACGERVMFSRYVSEPQTAAKKDDDDLALLQIKKMVENRQLFNKN